MAIFVLVIVVSCLLYSGKADLPILNVDDLFDSHLGYPVCVYFKNAGFPTDHENLLIRFLKHKQEGEFKQWRIGSIDIMTLSQIHRPPDLYPTTVPSLQCDVGLSKPLQYLFPTNSYKEMVLWFSFAAKQIQARIQDVTQLESRILNNCEEISILIFSGFEYTQHMEKIYREIKNQFHSDQLRPLLIQTPNRSDLDSLFGVTQYPTILFFTCQSWIEKKSFLYQLHGLQNVQLQTIKLALKVIRLQAMIPDQSDVLEDIVETKYQQPPRLFCVFSQKHPESLMYVSKFEEIKQHLECEGVGFEFILMDICDGNNSRVFTRIIKSDIVKGFPVFLLIWQEVTDTHELKPRQVVFDWIPSTTEFFMFLKENKISTGNSRKSNSGYCFSEEDDRSLQCVNPYVSDGICAVSNISYSNNMNIMKHASSKSLKDDKKKKAYLPKGNLKRKKLGNLTVLSKDDWSTIIDTSTALNKKFLHQDYIAASLNIVVFIFQGCRYCEMMMPYFEKIQKFIVNIDNAAIYLLNCSSNTEICNRYNIRGFPSIKLFRSFPWSSVGSCLTQKYNRYHVVQDYHKPLEPYEEILQWISQSSLPVVSKTFLLGDVPSYLNHDVYLVATVITRYHALNYMPSTTYNKWFSFTCFQTVCELLFGKTACYVTFVKDFGVKDNMATTKNSDLFITKITLFRRDGIKSDLFELGVPIEATIKREEHSDIHKFHNVHRYNLPSKFRCEDDYSICTEYIISYVTDHSRLPVTKLTHDGFHTVRRFFQNGKDELNLPIVVILAHKENVTNHNPYYMEVMKAAYHLYREAVFTVLDVDEYQWWTSRFVPKTYNVGGHFNSTDDMHTKLHNFPRICVVTATDHSKAAFYPDLKSMAGAEDIAKLLWNVNAGKLIEFVQHYSEHKQDVIVDTKEF